MISSETSHDRLVKDDELTGGACGICVRCVVIVHSGTTITLGAWWGSCSETTDAMIESPPAVVCLRNENGPQNMLSSCQSPLQLQPGAHAYAGLAGLGSRVCRPCRIGLDALPSTAIPL